MTIAYILCLILATSCCRLRRYEIMMVLNHGQYYAISLCEENSRKKTHIYPWIDWGLRDNVTVQSHF